MLRRGVEACTQCSVLVAGVQVAPADVIHALPARQSRRRHRCNMMPAEMEVQQDAGCCSLVSSLQRGQQTATLLPVLGTDSQEEPGARVPGACCRATWGSGEHLLMSKQHVSPPPGPSAAAPQPFEPPQSCFEAPGLPACPGEGEKSCGHDVYCTHGREVTAVAPHRSSRSQSRTMFGSVLTAALLALALCSAAQGEGGGACPGRVAASAPSSIAVCFPGASSGSLQRVAAGGNRRSTALAPARS